MSKRRRVTVEKSRDVMTYTELWSTSNSLLQRGQDQEEGSYHQFMGSLVFTAFTLEAYLNHLGPKVFKCWDALQRLGPKEKLDILVEKIGLEIDYGKRPWGIMKELFGFRNDIAHGKSIEITEPKTLSVERHDDHLREFAKSRWETFCTRTNAERAKKDVGNMVRALHEKAGIQNEHPFIGGIQSGHVTLVEEAVPPRKSS